MSSLPPSSLPSHTPAPQADAALLTGDAAQLSQHLGHCRQASGPLHHVRSAVELADAFLTSRFVSTLFVLAVVLAVLLGGLGWIAA